MDEIPNRFTKYILPDDVEDFRDNSSSFITPSEISPYSVHQALNRRENGFPGQYHISISQKLIPNTVSHT